LSGKFLYSPALDNNPGCSHEEKRGCHGNRRCPGGRTLNGIVTYPSDYQAGRRYPLVLAIHGGPNSSSREKFNLLPQVMAAHGWVVWRQGPGDDVMSGVEYLKGRGLVDPARMAVTGWSYGGFMTPGPHPISAMAWPSTDVNRHRAP
jgi:Prolyl oligopeptidase family